MKKILILGGSHRDIPLIKASRELGYFVATLGDPDYYLGHQYADTFYKVDFNDIDKIKKIVRNDKFDFLVPGSGEESYLKTVQISQELGMGNFDDLETAKLVHNKWKFKEFCMQHHISVPKGIFYSDITDFDMLKYPIVVKPTNLSGGRGIEIVENEEQLRTHIKSIVNITKENIFLEEYIEGELIAYSIFLQNQKIVYDFIAKDDTFLNKYLITTAYPVTMKKEMHQRIKKEIEKLSKLLNLVDGMFHLQILIKDDTPYIIDVTRRIPGDFFPDLIEYCDKISYNKAVIQAYTTGQIDNWFKTKTKEQNFIIRHVVMPSSNGSYKSLYIDEKLKSSILNIFDLEIKGTVVADYLHTQLTVVFIKIPKKNMSLVKSINTLIYPIMRK